MKVTGEATVGAPPQEVWAALHDRAVLARAVPGCERLESDGPGSGRFIVTTTMTAIGGTYSGQLTATGGQEPSSVELTASASGDQGEATADLVIRLTPTEGGATLVSYEANGAASGAIAGVGTRLLASAAKRLADEFLASLDEVMAGEPAPATPPQPESEARPAAGVRGPAELPTSPGSLGLDGRLDGRTGALIATALAVIVAIILLGRQGRRARSGQS